MHGDENPIRLKGMHGGACGSIRKLHGACVYCKEAEMNPCPAKLGAIIMPSTWIGQRDAGATQVMGPRDHIGMRVRCTVIHVHGDEAPMRLTRSKGVHGADSGIASTWSMHGMLGGACGRFLQSCMVINGKHMEVQPPIGLDVDSGNGSMPSYQVPSKVQGEAGEACAGQHGG